MSSDWFKIILNYKYIICQQILNLIYSNVIICFILIPFLTLPFQPFLPFPLKLQNIKTPNETLMSVCCVCVWRLWISFTYMMESIVLKLISASLINDYFCLWTRWIIFHFTWQCSKVKLSILNNFIIIIIYLLY